MPNESPIQVRLRAVESQLARLVAHLESESALCRRDINRLEQSLFGNGQPGALAVMNARLVKLERYAAYLAGGIGVIAGSMALLLYTLEHLK